MTNVHLSRHYLKYKKKIQKKKKDNLRNPTHHTVNNFFLVRTTQKSQRFLKIPIMSVKEYQAEYNAFYSFFFLLFMLFLLLYVVAKHNFTFKTIEILFYINAGRLFSFVIKFQMF